MLRLSLQWKGGRNAWAQHRAGCGEGILVKGNCSLALAVLGIVVLTFLHVEILNSFHY